MVLLVLPGDEDHLFDTLFDTLITKVAGQEVT